ncbi:sugar ABC transporter substrate-binding protein [Subtercola sp. YIM 133946]|uniref:sugar ABC transporter substrate-binding protein n=1 Tax=Subtercola sp. YIM 133946 TaxID=3118909 RepID=UPI002F93D7E3
MISIARNRRARRVIVGVAAIATTALLLTGCRGGGTTASSEDKATGKGLVIGWSQRGISGSDWWKTLVEGGQAQASSIGATVDVLDANGDTVRQNADIQTLITKGVDVLVINANDPIGIAPSIAAAKAAGIPVVTVNSNLDPSIVPDTFCYVAEDQGATGALAGEVAAKKAVEKFGDTGEIKIVGIGGFPGDVLTDLRFNGFMKGFNDVIAADPGITVNQLPIKYGSWKPDQALAPIRDVATANPDLKVVYSMSDVMNGGVVQGLQQAGIYGDGIIMASYDGGMVSVKTMQDDPTGPLQADASNQPWDQGTTAVKIALAAYNKDQTQCPDKTLYIKTTVVTPDNAASYYKPSDTYVRAQDGQ